jgi:hypothetical protein
MGHRTNRPAVEATAQTRNAIAQVTRRWNDLQHE